MERVAGPHTQRRSHADTILLLYAVILLDCNRKLDTIIVQLLSVLPVCLLHSVRVLAPSGDAGYDTI